MKFKNFIAEKYLESSRAPLYHWTDSIYLENILKLNALGVTDEWDEIHGTKTLKKDGWVSFTRDKNYRIRGKNSTVRFSFNPEILKQRGYKILPYVDRSVVDNYIDQNPLSKSRARFESEEKVKGPIKLTDGLIKIEIIKSEYNKLKNFIKMFKEHKDEALKTAKQIDDGTFKWSIEYWKSLSPNNTEDGFSSFILKAKEELKKDPNWVPKKYKSSKSFIETAKNYQELIDKTENVLKRVSILND